VVAPAEDALIGTCQRRSGFHALIARDAVEAVLVAAPCVDRKVKGGGYKLCITKGITKLEVTA